MEFDKSKVYTALNAEELEAGDEVILANYLEFLQAQVKANSWPTYVKRLDGIMSTSSTNRFKSGGQHYNLAYLVSRPGEAKPENKKLSEKVFKGWKSFKYDADKDSYVVYIDHYGEPCLDFGSCAQWDKIQEYKGAKNKLFVGSKEECKAWCNKRDNLAKIILAWENGRDVQFYSLMERRWVTLNNPSWDGECEYRVKPNGLVWKDLKMGDILWMSGRRPVPLGGKYEYEHFEERRIVTGIVDDSGTKRHVQLGGDWINDEDLEKWSVEK